MSEDQDTLDALLDQDTDRLADVAWWRRLAIGATASTLLCASLAVMGWGLRPDVVPLVKIVQVDPEGVARAVRTVPMAQYTPADWQWVGMLRQFVLALRWRGLDVRQTHLAWEWLTWHSCGEAVEQLQRYFAVDEPFDHVGTRKREILDVNVTKGDIDGLWTVLWKEIYVQGARPPVTTLQSVSFAVARRTVKQEMEQINGFGLCVKKFGGLKL
jgi:type IV secretory pathway TrbF-like protein